MINQLEQMLAAYHVWLDRQPLVANTRSAYRLQVHQFGAYLAQRPPAIDDPLHQPCTGDYVAEVAGHKRLETTPRYSLPSLEDHERAMEGLHVDD